jgi:YVTN family beta-propeller protein
LLRDENSVAIVDTASRTKIGTVSVGRGPIRVHVTPDGRFRLRRQSRQRRRTIRVQDDVRAIQKPAYELTDLERLPRLW